MQYEIDEQFTTSASKDDVQNALVKEFDLIAEVYCESGIVRVTSIDSAFGAYYHSDTALISTNKENLTCRISASVYYTTSFTLTFQVAAGLIIPAFIYAAVPALKPVTIAIMAVTFIIGCIMPFVFYLSRREVVFTMVKNVLARVKYQFTQQQNVPAAVPVAQSPMHVTGASSSASPTTSMPSTSPSFVPFAGNTFTHERVQVNEYASLRRLARRMTTIGYSQIISGSLMLLIGIYSLVKSIGASSPEISSELFANLMSLGSALIPIVICVTGYRALLNANATFVQRDELLMRIDVAINTAIIAAHITKLTQPTVTNPKSDTVV